MSLRKLLPVHIERCAQFFPCGDRSGLAVGLNGRDQGARHFRFLRQPLLGKLPVLTPDPERGLASKPALGDLQRDEFVLASSKRALAAS